MSKHTLNINFKNCKHTPADMIMPPNTFYTCFACAENPKPYTPTTEEVRNVYQRRLIKVSDNRFELIDEDQANAEFDRWLFHMQEDAWDRGYQAGIVDSPYSSPRIILTAKEVEQLNKALDREEDA